MPHVPRTGLRHLRLVAQRPLRTTAGRMPKSLKSLKSLDPGDAARLATYT